ncbi:rhomboid family intramembrane serine protease [Candidatus Fermentibacteria bacterium]|nr:rhomboid family intramembrane serine protease [Candidatus Fermentibacteria bacterium]
MNAGAFVVQLAMGMHRSVWQGGVIPWEIARGRSLEVASRLHPGLTLIAAIFLHGGLIHLAGNMLYLWVFGPGVEYRLGRGRFLSLYIASGVVGMVAHAYTNPDSLIPAIGASGAVAGVLGAYLCLFPKGRIRSLLVLIIFLSTVDVPAGAFIGVWVVFHAVAALMAGETAVAIFAHLGGFIVGCIAAERWRRKE